DFAVEVEPEEYNPPSFQDFRRPPKNPYNDPDPEDEDEYANFMPKPTPHQTREERPMTVAVSTDPLAESTCLAYFYRYPSKSAIPPSHPPFMTWHGLCYMPLQWV